MRAPLSTLLIGLAALAAGACTATPVAQPQPARPLGAQAQAAYARVVAPGAVPAAIAGPARVRAQAEADRASERREIDYFALPDQPLGLAIGRGPAPAWLLGYLGTGRTDADLNVELRALVAGGGGAADVGVTMNYTGETTLGRSVTTSKGGESALDRGASHTVSAPAFAMPAPHAPTSRTGSGPRFELLMGLPGNGVADAYADHATALAGFLARRFQARPFALDEVPIVFAVLEGDRPTGFVFTNQGNRLVLGERKYADVQSVVCLTAEAELAAAYTVVAFNRKTDGPGAAPVWQLERDSRFGTLARCGDGPGR